MRRVHADTGPDRRRLAGSVLFAAFLLALVSLLVCVLSVDRDPPASAASEAPPTSPVAATVAATRLTEAVRARLASHRNVNDADTLHVERGLAQTDAWFREEGDDPDEERYLAARVENADLWARKLGLAIAGATCKRTACRFELVPRPVREGERARELPNRFFNPRAAASATTRIYRLPDEEQGLKLVFFVAQVGHELPRL